MALNVEKLRAKAAKKPVGKPVGKEVAAQYYARQEAAKNKNTDAEGTAQASAPAAGTGTAVGAGTPSVPAASAPVDAVSSARAYLDGLAANLGAVKQSGTADGNGKPMRINGDLRGVAKQGLSGAFGKDLPSGAPAVRPGVQKSLDDYAAAVKAVETLDASGKLTEGDVSTLNKAFDTAVSDASAYDTIASRQAPVDFANKVDNLQSKPESGVRHDTYTAARPMEAIGGADGAKMSFDEIRSANENFNKRYEAVYKDYTSGKATEADLTALGKEKAKLDKDNNAFLASAQDSFEKAVKKAYVKYVPRAERMEAEKKPGIPSGYNGAAADAAEADVQSLYMDVYAKFLRGEATEKELAELKGKAEAVKAQNEAFWETTDGIIEYGKRLQANRDTLKKDLDEAKKKTDAARDDLGAVSQKVDLYARQQDPQSYNAYMDAYKVVFEAEAEQKRAEAAYNAANYAVNLNDLQYTYNVKYKSAYEAAKKGGYKDPADIQRGMVQAVNYNLDDAVTYHVDDLQKYGTNEWKSVYLFLRETKGAKAANEFANTIRHFVDIVKAREIAKKYSESGLVGKMAIGAFTQAAGGLSDFGAGALGVGKALIGDTSYTFPTTAQSVASGVREAEKGTAAGIAMDMIRSTANMAPSIAIGAAMQAAGLPGAALVRSISFGGSAAGNAYIQSINEGKDYGESVLYGAVVGASEVCLERALGGIEGLGGKGVSRFMQTKAGKAVQARLSSFLSKFGTTVKRRTALEFFNATGRFLSNNTSEGIEEFTQDMLDPIFRNVIFGEENAVFTQENFDNAMYSFCVGFWNAGLLNATSEISRFKKVNRILKGTGTMQDVTDALESPEMRRDLERIFTRTFADAQDGKFTFSDDELVNTVFLEMWQKGVKQGTAHAEDIRAAAGDAAEAARSGAELAEAVNKAADSVADSVGEDIRQSQRVVDADVTADSEIRTEQAAAEPVRENAEQARGRAVSTAGAAENAGATVETETPTASAVESTGDVGTVSAESTASDTSKIEQIKQKAISPKEALDNSSPYADESYSEIDKKSSRAAEALSGALGVNIKIFRDTTGIGSFYDSASDTLYIDGDGELPVSYQLRRGLMTLLASSDSAGFAKLRDFLVGKYIEMFGKDAYTEYADKKKKVFAKDGLSLDDIGVGNELCADLGVFMLSDADTARAIAKELRKPEAKKLLRALEMLSKTEGVNFDFLPTAVDSLSEADMKAAEKMVLDMFFRDGVGKDRKNSYVVAEKSESKASQTNDAHGAVDSKAEQVEKELAETSSIKLKHPFSNYSEDKQKTIEDFVEYRDERIRNFVNEVISGTNTETYILLDNVAEDAIERIKALTGVDTTGFKTAIEDRFVKHIDAQHGKDGAANRSMFKDEDWERISYVLNNFDNINFGGRSSAYSTNKKNGFSAQAKTVIYSKAINGTFYVVEAVPDTKRRCVVVTSAYTSNEREATTHTMHSPAETSETYSADFSTKNIPKNDVVNASENVNNLQNKAASAAVNTDAVPEVTGKTDVQAEQEVESKAKTVTEPKAKTEVKAEAPVEPSVRKDMSREANGEAKAKEETTPEVKISAESETVSEENNGVSEEEQSFLETVRHTAQSLKEALKSKKQGGIYSGTDEQTIRATEDLSKAFGVRILLFDGEGKTDIDGFYDRKTNTIYLNAGSHAKPIQATVRHEMIHFLVRANTGAFEAFRDFIVGRYAETYGKEALDTWLRNKQAEYVAAGIELDENGAKEELCADLAMDMLNDPETVKGFAKENRSAARRILDALRRFIDKIRVLFGLEPKYSAGKARALEVLAKTDSTVKITDGKVERSHASFKNDTLPKALNVKDLYTAEKLLYNALVSAEVRNGKAETKSGFADENADIRYASSSNYDFTKSFAEQVDDFKKGKIPAYDSLVVSGTPEIYQKVGFNALPITLNQTHADYALNGTKDADHFLGEPALKQLPQAIADPVAIIGSQTQSGRAVAILKFDVNGKQVVVPMEIDGYGRVNNVIIDSNAIVSVYGKNTALQQLRSAILDELNGQTSLFYWNKKEAVALAQLAGLQLPGGLPKDGFIHSIRESGSKVNTKLENVTHSQQFKRWFGDWENKPYSASKVVDADGKPLVVYHGTDADFTVFKSKDGNYWFSASEDYAEAMAEERGGNRVMPTYLNMRKPYYAKLKPSQFSDPNFEAAIIREAKSKGYDGVILENDTSNDLEKDTFYVVFAPTQIKSATDNIGTFDGSNPDIRYSKSGTAADTKKNVFSYEALTAKPDMPLTDINTNIPRDENGKVIRKEVADLAIQAVRDSGNKKNTEVDFYVHVDDTNSDLKVSIESIRHGLTRKPDLNAIAALNIVGLAKNAVLINELSPREGTVGGNVYLSAGKDSDNNLYFVRLVIDKKNLAISEIETVYAISTKKESVAHYRQGYENKIPFAFTDSTISIADLLDFVKNHFSDILPESVLQHYGISRKESAVSNSVMYSFNADKDSVQTIPKGEAPARDVDVRAFDEHGGKVSEGVRTVAEASVTPDSYVKPLLEDVAKGKYSHEIKTNKGAMARAENVIARDGYQETAERYLKDFEDGRSFGKDDIAVLQTLYAGAAQHMDYLSGTDGDITLAEKLVVAMVQTATNAGQALQAQRLLKKLSPEGTLYAYEKSVNRINRAIERSAGEWDGENNTRVKESGKGIFKNVTDSFHEGYYSPKQAPVEIDADLKKKLLNAKNPHEMDKVCEEIENDVAKQILSTIPDKLRAWRYMSMLTNPRTHVRNIVGNALFGIAIQTRDIVGTIAEKVIIRDKSKRTKAIALTPKQRSEYKAIAKHAARFYDEHEAFVKGESNRYDMTTSNIEAAKKPFKNRFLGAILNAIYEFNSNLLEKEDLWFIKGHFVRQFTHALMAKGYTAEQLKNGELPAEVLQKIAEYASNEAQKATFRDANAAATVLNRIENMSRGTKVAVSAIMPFKKTPMNILRRGIEYSPVSLITAVYKTISQNVQKSKGRIKSVDTAGIINDFSQGLTGSMIFALGAWLLSQGILKSGDDEDEKKQSLEEAMGKQSYSIEIGGESFTLDWAAPLCMPLFAGAEFAKALQEKEIDPMQALLRMSDPILETSMMSGMLDFISSAKYADGNSGILQKMTQSAVSSYVLQFFPTAMGAVARVMDEYESRTTRTDKKGDAAFWERLGRQIINKIPYARQVFNKPYVDVFGKQEKKEKPLDYALSLIKNTIVPGYITSVSGTKSEKVLYEVMEESKETKFIPGFVTKFAVDKVQHTLTQEEYYNYHVMRGAWYEAYLPEVASEEWFTDLEADQKAIVLESFKEIADDLTKKRVIPEYTIRSNRSKYIYNMLYGDKPVSGQEAVNVVKQVFHEIILSELAKKQAEEEREKLLDAESTEAIGK